MRKIIDIFKVISICVLVNCLSVKSAHAFLQKAVPTKTVYCPEKISCAKTNNTYTCQKLGGTPEYWENNVNYVQATQVQDFEYAMASVGAGGGLSATCYYRQGGKLEVVFEANIEAQVGRGLKWIVNESSAYCYSNNVKLCPLHEVPELFFNTCYSFQNGTGCSTLDFEIYANNKLIKAGYFLRSLNYDEALSGCGSVKQCKIDIVWGPKTRKDLFVKGSVVIDLTDNMKIISVTQDSPDTFGTMKKSEKFNTINFLRREDQ